MNPGFTSFRTAEHAVTEPVRNHIYVGNLKSLTIPHCPYLTLYLLTVTDWSVPIMSGYWPENHVDPTAVTTISSAALRLSLLLSHLVSNALAKTGETVTERENRLI